MNKKLKNKSGKLNTTILILSILLGVIGLFVILSSSAYLTIKHGGGKFYYVKRQGGFLIMGIILMLVVSRIDYRNYRKYGWLIYLISLVLLGMSLGGPFAKSYNFTRRGVKLGPISFMPSDIYKLASIIFFANFLVKNRKNRDKFFKGMVLSGLIIVVPSLIMILQPDFSTFATIVMVLLIMYIVYGLPKKFAPVLVLIIGLALFVLYKVADYYDVYQLKRIFAFRDPEKYYLTDSWQILNSLFSVSRGGVTGVGFGQSIFKYGYLAEEVNNDMIFAVIAEETGFIGSVIFIGIIVAFVISILKVAIKVKDPFGKLVVFGIGMLIFIQSFINIGVSLNLVPNTGITLPFISYGGTSLGMMYVMTGVVLNISRFEDK